MIKIISYLYLKFKKCVYGFIIKYTNKNNLCIIDDYDYYYDCDYYYDYDYNLNIQIKLNTSSNLQVLQNFKQINWFCKTCYKQISKYSNIYCCNDFIFCTYKCRKRFLNNLK
jgi:hypothetical protein